MMKNETRVPETPDNELLGKSEYQAYLIVTGSLILTILLVLL
jgi:hypothetical protein